MLAGNKAPIMVVWLGKEESMGFGTSARDIQEVI